MEDGTCRHFNGNGFVYVKKSFYVSAHCTRMASLYLCVSAVETFCTHYVYVYTQLCFNTFILNHSMSAARMSLYTVCLVPNWFSLPFRLASFKIG